MARARVLASLCACLATAPIAGCDYGRPPYILPPQTTAEDLYANPRQCGWDEWRKHDEFRRQYDEFRKAVPLGKTSLTRTNKLVVLGREVALIGNGQFQVLDVDAKSIRHLDIPDYVVDATRGDGRIWIVTKAVGAGTTPARVWSYSHRALELISELPMASCKTLFTLAAAGDTVVVLGQSTVASQDMRSWRPITLGNFSWMGRLSSFACLDPTHCFLGSASGAWFGGNLISMNLATGQSGTPPSLKKRPSAWCGGDVNGVIVDPVDASCALFAMGLEHRGERGCILRICGDSASAVLVRPKTGPGGGEGEAVWALAAREGHLIASTGSGVYELGEGQEQALPLRFEAIGGIWASFAVPGLVVISAIDPMSDDGQGRRKLLAVIDPG